MKKTFAGNGLDETQVVEDAERTDPGASLPRIAGIQAYVPETRKLKPYWKENRRVVIAGAGFVVVLLLWAFSGISRAPSAAKKSVLGNNKQTTATFGTGGAVQLPSVTPIIDAGRFPGPDTDRNFLTADDVARTVNSKPGGDPRRNLGSVRPFNKSQSWQAPPYRLEPNSLSIPGPERAMAETASPKSKTTPIESASLVFVGNHPPSTPTTKAPESTAANWTLGLPPGARLRARLESAVSTAVRTPVIAVIEYNYELHGQIVIAAGVKAFGHLDEADRSGYVGVHFDSLMRPDGSLIAFEGAATDLELRPLRGRVEGKNTGKNILVRSFAGLGQIAATLAGRGSLNQPLSESDLLRERISSNIGQASDQEVANLAIRERTVVSVPAHTEIYIVLQKPIKDNALLVSPQLPTRTASQTSIEELRQLLRLQRELNETQVGKSSPD